MNKKCYRVFINGNNFLIKFERKGIREVGFYTNYFVEAEDSNSAKEVAIDLLRQHPKLQSSVCNTKNNLPVINVEEIQEWVLDENFAPNQQPALILYGQSDPGENLKDGEIVIHEIE